VQFGIRSIGKSAIFDCPLLNRLMDPLTNIPTRHCSPQAPARARRVERGRSQEARVRDRQARPHREGEHRRVRDLSIASDALIPTPKCVLQVSFVDDEQKFLDDLKNDKMAYDKLHEGIAGFDKDGKTLKDLLKEKLSS
jgi:hypothetical protein